MKCVNRIFSIFAIAIAFAISSVAAAADVDPRTFGAKGDGTTDDTTAISNMFAAYTAKSASFNCYGLTHKLTSTIKNTLSANVAWVIKNCNFTTLTIAEPVGEAGAISIWGDEVAGSPYVGTNRVTLEDVTFTDNRTAAVGTLDGIQLEQLDQVSLKNVRAKGYSNTGIFIEVARMVYAENCDGSNNLYAGMRSSNVYQSVVTGGTYNNNGKTIPTDGYGVAFSAGDQVNSNINVLVQGVTANGNKRKGIDFHAGVNVNIVNNHVAGFGLMGIYALADETGDITRNVIIHGNVVSGDANLSANGACISVGASGALASSAGQWMVVNNIIDDCHAAGAWAIEIDANSTNFSPDIVLVSGNRITNSGSSTTAPIAVHGSNLQIANVKISNNFTYTTAAKYCIDIQNAINSIIDGNSCEITGGTVTMGINVVDSASRPVMISNNNLLGAATYSGTITDFVSNSQATTNNNRYSTTLLKSCSQYQRCVDWGSDVPVAGDGYYGVGSIRWNTTAAAGGSPGWVCTTAGVTGSGSVWKAMANVGA